MMQSRTHNCNQLRIENVGEKVKLVGWMENVREVGGNLAFVVLRDFYGTTQVVVEDEADLKVIKGINKESTISVEGTVRERASKNPKLPTGDIEVVPSKIEVLGRCRYNSLPFEINRSREADETQRLKYRYLDLRNPAVKKNIILRCQVIAALRQAMMAHDFLEITTPILTASSPEGARDYLVPARKHPGKFYALPQAPQQFKQLLMTSGFDRYFQIAPCFRDEVLPPHAQAALTQAIRPALFRQEAPGPVQQGTSADSHHTPALLGQVCLAFFPSLLLTIPFYDNILRWICQAFGRELFYSLASTTPVRSTGVPSRHRRSSP